MWAYRIWLSFGQKLCWCLFVSVWIALKHLPERSFWNKQCPGWDLSSWSISPQSSARNECFLPSIALFAQQHAKIKLHQNWDELSLVLPVSNSCLSLLCFISVWMLPKYDSCLFRQRTSQYGSGKQFLSFLRGISSYLQQFQRHIYQWCCSQRKFLFSAFSSFLSAVFVRRKVILLAHQSPLALLEASPYRSQSDTAYLIQRE